MENQRIEKIIEKILSVYDPSWNDFGVIGAGNENLDIRVLELCNVKSFMGGRDHLGSGDVFNTPISKFQLNTALAMGKRGQYKTVKEMIGKKPLEGLRIMDLGCGFKPGFARIARVLGAGVYTVDVIPAKDIVESLNDPTDEIIKKEKDFHIVGDLNDAEEVLKNIQEKVALESFDLVTHANLFTPTFTKKENGETTHVPRRSAILNLAIKLLKEGGIYYSPSGIGKASYSGVTINNFFLKQTGGEKN